MPRQTTAVHLLGDPDAAGCADSAPIPFGPYILVPELARSTFTWSTENGVFPIACTASRKKTPRSRR